MQWNYFEFGINNTYNVSDNSRVLKKKKKLNNSLVLPDRS